MLKNRPQSIIWFERAFWFSFAAVLFDEVVALFSGGPTLGLSIFFEIAITVLLWHLIAVKAKDWARWLYIVLTTLSVVMTILAMIQDKSFFVHTPCNLNGVVATISRFSHFGKHVEFFFNSPSPVLPMPRAIRSPVRSAGAETCFRTPPRQPGHGLYARSQLVPRILPHPQDQSARQDPVQR